MSAQPTPRNAPGRHRRPTASRSRSTVRNLTLAGATLLAMAGGLAAAGPASADAPDAHLQNVSQGPAETAGVTMKPAAPDSKPGMGGLAPDPNPFAKPSPGGGVGIFRNVVALEASVEAVVRKYHPLPQNRPGFVKSMRDDIAAGLGNTYNVMVFNTEDQPYEEHLTGGPAPDDQPYRTTEKYDGTQYTIWVFKDGTFTNKGDGGYTNWAYTGWFDNDGNTVTFHKGPDAPEGALPEDESAVKPEGDGQDCGEADGLEPFTDADSLGIAHQVEDKINNLCLRDSDLTRKLSDIAYEAGGGKYNALVFNTKQGYEWQGRADMPYAGNVAVGDKVYGIWLVGSGAFTNKGDAGYGNWAFSGSWDRDGNTVTFHDPSGGDEAQGVDAASTAKSCVTVTDNATGDGLGIAGQLTDLAAGGREDCVKKVVDRVFNAAGQKYNVVVANQSNDNDVQLNGVHSYLTVKQGDVYYGIWVFEDGTFTNNGDRGWSNWGMTGWFDSSNDGRTATFRKP